MKKAVFLGIAVLSIFAAVVMSSESNVAKTRNSARYRDRLYQRRLQRSRHGSDAERFHPSFRIQACATALSANTRSTIGSRASRRGKRRPISIPRTRSGITRSPSSIRPALQPSPRSSSSKTGQHIYTDYLSLRSSPTAGRLQTRSTTDTPSPNRRLRRSNQTYRGRGGLTAGT